MPVPVRGGVLALGSLILGQQKGCSGKPPLHAIMVATGTGLSDLFLPRRLCRILVRLRLL